ncbi:hypothetical protein AVEN_148911-1 [Araneus ventricosus]|uniref:Uncharacterized protein n=1 Tax=Araneus ventricosus TaxID=182803 RepID=A0A4Y2DIB8_ARAVE|nr:hypothetical protein AVEN_148911-1 [Araneus ventricosus]
MDEGEHMSRRIMASCPDHVVRDRADGSVAMQMAQTRLNNGREPTLSPKRPVSVLGNYGNPRRAESQNLSLHHSMTINVIMPSALKINSVQSKDKILS